MVRLSALLPSLALPFDMVHDDVIGVAVTFEFVHLFKSQSLSEASQQHYINQAHPMDLVHTCSSCGCFSVQPASECCSCRSLVCFFVFTSYLQNGGLDKWLRTLSLDQAQFQDLVACFDG